MYFLWSVVQTLQIFVTDFSATTVTNPRNQTWIIKRSTNICWYNAFITLLYVILQLYVKYMYEFLFIARLICSLEDGYVVVYLGLLSLCDALRDPDDVATLLLLQLDVGVKYSKVELLQESKCVQLHLRKDREDES